VNVLLLNAGSSTLKGTLIEPASRQEIATGLADWAGSTVSYQYVGPDGKTFSEGVHWKGHAQAVHRFLSDVFNREPRALADHSQLAGVGHRIVHGGPFTASVRITPDIRSRISVLADLAPLHNPPSLATLSAAEEELPRVPHVAVFDTAFHSTLPAEACTYPVPAEWTETWGIRRFGFHGLSYAYCATRAAEMLNRPLSELKLVICHLGNGCSAAAVQGGRSIDTTMGFSPLEGLMMGTRSGSIDPSIVLYAQMRHGMSVEDVETTLNRESGLLGMTGISSDMRQVLSAASQGQAKAKLAVAVYVHRVRQAIGALVATLGGCDALVFTAGVGEHATEIRKLVCSGLECMGLSLDPTANASGKPDADIAHRSSRGRILVIATREDLTMLDEVMRLLDETTTDATAATKGFAL
jgi:acetate kinase